MLDLIKIGKKISEKRKELSMTQDELAEKLFVTHQAVSKWENGKSIPTIDVLVLLTKTLNISIDYLLDHSEVDEQDYETWFRNYPRETAFNHIMSNFEDINHQEILYLLSKEERNTFITKLAKTNASTIIEACWPYFTSEERFTLISIAYNEKDSFLLPRNLSHYSVSEQSFISKLKKSGGKS